MTFVKDIYFALSWQSVEKCNQNKFNKFYILAFLDKKNICCILVFVLKKISIKKIFFPFNILLLSAYLNVKQINNSIIISSTSQDSFKI